MSMTGETIVFYVLSAIILLSALAVVTLRNIVHSALLMVLTFVGVAGIYLMLNADFLAAVQLIVYAGAIAILIAFGVMLTVRGDIKESNKANKQWGLAAFASAALFSAIYWLYSQTTWATTAPEGAENTVELLSSLMLGDYVVAFETAAVLLLVAMLGAIVIAKEVNNSK